MFRRILAVLLLPLLLAVVPVGVNVAQAATTPTTYVGSTFPSSVKEPTADKPQSKIWFAGGSWWALMASSTDGQAGIYQLGIDHVWRSTGVVVDSRVNSTADALWTGDQLYVASRLNDSVGVRVSSFSFNAQTSTWSRTEGPVTLGTGSVRSVTIAQDTSGRLWVTYLSNQRIYVRGTTSTSISSWGDATELSASTGKVYSTDISSVVAFGDQVGVMWSNQNTKTFYFAVHSNAAPVTQWSVETAWSGPKVADDHISLRSIPGDDRVFAVVKTSKDALGVGSEVLLAGLVRSSSGSWTVDPFGTVADNYTRPVLSLDVEHNLAYVFFTNKSGGGTILYKTSPIASTFDFNATPGTFISKSGVSINNATTAKQPVTSSSDLVVLAAASRYYHGELDIAGAPDLTAPSIPQGLSASNVTSNAAELSWQPSTDDSGVASYRLYRDGLQVGAPATTNFLDTGLAPEASYQYTVAAVDTSGNVSDPSGPLTVTTTAGSSSAIAFRAASSGDNGTGATSLVLPVPGGTAPGDAMMAAVAVRGAPTITPPAGWQLVRMDPSGTTMRQAVFSHVAGASEPASYTWGLSNSQVAVGAVSAYSGVSTAAPVSASSGQINASMLGITAPSVNVATDGSALVGFFGIARLTTVTPPTALTERIDRASIPTAPYAVSLEASDLSWAPAGPTGAKTATAANSGTNIGQLVVLQPAG